jgi:hypothetical protein
MRTKIHPGVFLTETDRVYRVDSSYRNGFTRKRKSESIKKTGDVCKDLAALEKVKESVISHYEQMEYISAVGIIKIDTEYSIRGLNFVAGRQGEGKAIIVVKLSIQRRGESALNKSFSTYDRLVEIWPDVTDALMIFHGLDAKPKEWVSAPSELYYERLQVRLIRHKNKLSKQ